MLNDSRLGKLSCLAVDVGQRACMKSIRWTEGTNILLDHRLVLRMRSD